MKRPEFRPFHDVAAGTHQSRHRNVIVGIYGMPEPAAARYIRLRIFCTSHVQKIQIVKCDTRNLPANSHDVVSLRRPRRTTDRAISIVRRTFSPLRTPIHDFPNLLPTPQIATAMRNSAWKKTTERPACRHHAYDTMEVVRCLMTQCGVIATTSQGTSEHAIRVTANRTIQPCSIPVKSALW